MPQTALHPEKPPPPGIETQVFRVTRGNTSHYTAADLSHMRDEVSVRWHGSVAGTGVPADPSCPHAPTSPAEPALALAVLAGLGSGRIVLEVAQHSLEVPQALFGRAQPSSRNSVPSSFACPRPVSATLASGRRWRPVLKSNKPSLLWESSKPIGSPERRWGGFCRHPSW